MSFERCRDHGSSAWCSVDETGRHTDLDAAVDARYRYFLFREVEHDAKSLPPGLRERMIEIARTVGTR